MMQRNVYFALASENNNSKPGLRPGTGKLERFNVMVPQFKLHKVFFPIEKKATAPLIEAVNELSLASKSGFRSKHDDFIDTVSQLAVMNAWRPSETGDLSQQDEDGIWSMEDEDEMDSPMSSYVV